MTHAGGRDRVRGGRGRAVDDAELAAAFARTWAAVWDMIVAPETQRQGIGEEILRRLLRRAESRSLTVLVATAAGEPLYTRHGFVPADPGGVAMLLRRSR